MKQRAIIVDRDGTLASVAHVRPDDDTRASWAAFNAALPFDAPVPSVLRMLTDAKAQDPDVVIIMMSGRAAGDHVGDTRRFFQMRDWIVKHDLPIDFLLMREGGDTRRDSVVKDELFRVFVEPHFDVLFAIDDRPQVVEVWESHGIPVVVVSDPEILPPMVGQ